MGSISTCIPPEDETATGFSRKLNITLWAMSELSGGVMGGKGCNVDWVLSHKAIGVLPNEGKGENYEN